MLKFFTFGAICFGISLLLNKINGDTEFIDYEDFDDYGGPRFA